MAIGKDACGIDQVRVVLPPQPGAPASESTGRMAPVSRTAEGRVAPWIAMYERLQFELNCLGSVSIEVPALRPAFERLREALDGDA